jgi:hypothetical protein
MADLLSLLIQAGLWKKFLSTGPDHTVPLPLD